MKVSNHLPHFKEPNLLISTGKQEACFYLSHNDEVVSLESLKIKKSDYHEHFAENGDRRYDEARVRGALDDEATRTFIKQLSEVTTRLIAENGVKVLYLFCPTYLANQIESSLPTEHKKKIEFIFYGNYHNQHPFVLLSKVQEYLRSEAEEHKVQPIKNEALKILRTTTG